MQSTNHLPINFSRSNSIGGLCASGACRTISPAVDSAVILTSMMVVRYQVATRLVAGFHLASQPVVSMWIGVYALCVLRSFVNDWTMVLRIQGDAPSSADARTCYSYEALSEEPETNLKVRIGERDVVRHSKKS